MLGEISLDDTGALALYAKRVAWQRYTKVRRLWYYHASGDARRLYSKEQSCACVTRYEAERVSFDERYPDFDAAYNAGYPDAARLEQREHARRA